MRCLFVFVFIVLHLCLFLYSRFHLLIYVYVYLYIFFLQAALQCQFNLHNNKDISYKCMQSVIHQILGAVSKLHFQWLLQYVQISSFIILICSFSRKPHLTRLCWRKYKWGICCAPSLSCFPCVYMLFAHDCVKRTKSWVRCFLLLHFYWQSGMDGTHINHQTLYFSSIIPSFFFLMFCCKHILYFCVSRSQSVSIDLVQETFFFVNRRHNGFFSIYQIQHWPSFTDGICACIYHCFQKKIHLCQRLVQFIF